jgi:hypothetical protein
VKDLPELDERIERYVTQRFTETQKEEREATKRARIIAEETITSQDETEEPSFEFQLQVDQDNFDSEFEALSPRTPQTFNFRNFGAYHTYDQETGVPIRVINFVNHRTDAHILPPNPEEEEIPVGQQGTFNQLETRLNDFEEKVRGAQLAYETLMNFELHNDRQGLFVRRIYDRFNALGLLQVG